MLRRSQPLIAPLARLRWGCATTRRASKNSTAPRPSHFGSAHRLLNENSRLELGQRVVAFRQENFDEKRSSFLFSKSKRWPCRPHGAARSRRIRLAAASLRLHAQPSITTSTVCLAFFASARSASSSCTLPSTRTRVKPARAVRRTARRSLFGRPHRARIIAWFPRQRDHVVHHLRHGLRLQRDAVVRQ